MPSTAIRSFIAIELEASVRAELVRLQDAARASLPGSETALAWVPEANAHLTLVFLGPVPPAKLEALSTDLDAVARGVSPFDLVTAAPGLFGSERSPRVSWLGIAEPRSELTRLQEGIARACAEHGLGADEHSYHPHITAAQPRPRALRTAVIEAARVWRAAEPRAQRQRVTGFALMRSEKVASGPRYTPQRRFGLGG